METQTNAVKTPPSLAVAVLGCGTGIIPIVNAKGTQTGGKMAVGEQGSYKQIRDAIRAASPDLKGNSLTKRVNEIFYGQKDKSMEIATLLLSRLGNAGMVPDMVTVRKSTASLTFRKPSEQVARGAKAQKAADAILAGGVELSEATRKALIASLTAKPTETIEAEATPA
jgi:hypothetical protein